MVDVEQWKKKGRKKNMKKIDHDRILLVDLIYAILDRYDAFQFSSL